MRDCQEDILPLEEFFLGLANKELERNIKGFSASANNILLAYPWPGNVRELKQKILTAVLHAEGNMITDNDLKLCTEDNLFPPSLPFKDTGQKKEHIRRALEQANGNRSIAARLLGDRTFNALSEDVGIWNNTIRSIYVKKAGKFDIFPIFIATFASR